MHNVRREERLSLRVTDRQRQELRTLAAMRNQTLSEMMREALKFGIGALLARQYVGESRQERGHETIAA